MTQKNWSLQIILVSFFALSGCNKATFEDVTPGFEDEIVLADGLDYRILVRWGDPISEDHYFGYDNDYLNLIDIKSGEQMLWVSHSGIQPQIVSRYDEASKTRLMKQIELEKYNVGASLIRTKKVLWWWKLDLDNELNKRITGDTPIPFEWDTLVYDERESLGTIGHGSGAFTPWGTIMVGERNFQQFYGDYDYKNERFAPSQLQWETFTGRSPQLYGWVVEIDPTTGVAKKQVGAGRFSHSGMAIRTEADGRLTIYMGDDHAKGSVYKYIPSFSGQLYPGKLFVADFMNGKWELIDYQRTELKYLFQDETEMFIRTREAAEAIGGTQLGKVAGMDIDPVSGNLLISINQSADNPFGKILMLGEESAEPGSFSYSTYIGGGQKLVRPGDLRFDPAGNLWIASDIPSRLLGTDTFIEWGSNALFVVKKNEKKIFRVANAPKEAAFSGIAFLDEGETLFLSVKHPGQNSTFANYTSHWPDGGEEAPKPAVLVLTGDLLDQLADR